MKLTTIARSLAFASLCGVFSLAVSRAASPPSLVQFRNAFVKKLD